MNLDIPDFSKKSEWWKTVIKKNFKNNKEWNEKSKT